MNTLNTICRVLGYSIVIVCVSPLMPVVGLMHLIARIDNRGKMEPATAKNTNYLLNEPSFNDEPSFDSLSFPMAS